MAFGSGPVFDSGIDFGPGAVFGSGIHSPPEKLDES
jgi:hypothetical protein